MSSEEDVPVAVEFRRGPASSSVARDDTDGQGLRARSDWQGGMAHQFRVNRCLQADYELDYLFADASFFKYHPGAAGEPILTTWGITTEGKKVFIAERDFELVAQEQVLDHEVVALIEQGGQGREQDAE